MVVYIMVEGRKYYACGECGLVYRQRRLARECEEWCSKYKSCNRELAGKAVGFIRFDGFELRLNFR